MNAQQENSQSVNEAIWSLGVMLDYTERMAALVTPQLLDWRPQYPAGDYVFSIGEQVKHIADTRVFIAGNLSGEEPAYERWAADYPGKDAPWSFREGSLAEIMESLKYSRSLVQPWTERPFSEMLSPTAGTQAAFEKQLAGLKEKGEDSAMLEAKGPGTLASSLFFLVAHENGHRTVLQTLLRQAGATVERLA